MQIGKYGSGQVINSVGKVRKDNFLFHYLQCWASCMLGKFPTTSTPILLFSFLSLDIVDLWSTLHNVIKQQKQSIGPGKQTIHLVEETPVSGYCCECSALARHCPR